MYRSIVEKREFNINSSIKLMLSIISPTLNIGYEKVDTIIKDSLLYEDEINNCENKIIKNLLFDTQL